VIDNGGSPKDVDALGGKDGSDQSDAVEVELPAATEELVLADETAAWSAMVVASDAVEGTATAQRRQARAAMSVIVVQGSIEGKFVAIQQSRETAGSRGRSR